MRWTEIEGRAAETGETLPTYRLMDLWTRQGRLDANHLRGPGGKYRDWPEGEVEVALVAARLRACGMSDDLAFQVARTQPDADGRRQLYLDGAEKPLITVTVNGRE